MASYIQTASGTSANVGPIGTDKVRISTITPLAFAVGNANVTANITACEIVPANTVLNSVVVGEGNYIAFIAIGAGPHEPFSVTELGMPTNN